MTFSFKKVFTKEETEAEQSSKRENSDSDKQGSTHTDSANQNEKKGAHGEPGVCCGSCS